MTALPDLYSWAESQLMAIAATHIEGTDLHIALQLNNQKMTHGEPYINTSNDIYGAVDNNIYE